MSIWFALILLSALAGGICGLIFRGRHAIILGGAVPWTGLLAWLLYNEYFVPYQGGGASMWPIAQLVGGSVAAVVGIAAATTARIIKAR
jgi:hypothetical protein